MRKKLFLFIAGIFLFLAIANFISAEEVNYSLNYQYGGIQVVSLKYEPYPANPGEYVNVWIKANIGSSVNYAKFELIEEFPFSLDDNEDPIREYTDFQGDVIINYKVRVSDDAVEGETALQVGITSSKCGEVSSLYSMKIEIADAQTDFDLVIQDSTSSEISLAIANIGKNTANSMIVRIPEQDSFKVTGTNGQMVGNLDSGDYTIVGFSLSQVGRSEEPLIVKIDYTDNIGERRSVLKEIDFGSGSLINSSLEEGEIPEGFPEDFEFGNGFPGQKKKAKWPYFLAGILILGIAGYFVYRKYKEQIKSFLTKERKFQKKIEKKVSGAIPEWMKDFEEKQKAQSLTGLSKRGQTKGKKKG